jgi:hypothetical protein
MGVLLLPINKKTASRDSSKRSLRQGRRTIPRKLPIRKPGADVQLSQFTRLGEVIRGICTHGFRKIIGIDFAADLCLTARDNIEQYRRCTNNSAAISIEQRDACTYDIPNQPSVLFLYNPFNKSVMRSFVANVERSLSQHPREFYVIYHMPLWSKVWDASPIFSKLAGTHIWSADWYSLYSSKLIVQSRGAT